MARHLRGVGRAGEEARNAGWKRKVRQGVLEALPKGSQGHSQAERLRWWPRGGKSLSTRSFTLCLSPEEERRWCPRPDGGFAVIGPTPAWKPSVLPWEGELELAGGMPPPIAGTAGTDASSGRMFDSSPRKSRRARLLRYQAFGKMTSSVVRRVS